MAKITITEKQGWKCVEALEFVATFAERKGEMATSQDLRDTAVRLRSRLEYIDQKMRADGRRR
jgi:hypothetical protein